MLSREQTLKTFSCHHPCTPNQMIITGLIPSRSMCSKLKFNIMGTAVSSNYHIRWLVWILEKFKHLPHFHLKIILSLEANRAIVSTRRATCKLRLPSLISIRNSITSHQTLSLMARTQVTQICLPLPYRDWMKSIKVSSTPAPLNLITSTKDSS